MYITKLFEFDTDIEVKKVLKYINDWYFLNNRINYA